MVVLAQRVTYTAVAAVGYTGVYYNAVTCTAMQQYGNAVLLDALQCATPLHGMYPSADG